MIADDLPTLSAETGQLLSRDGKYKLSDDALIRLNLHFRMISSWANRIPEKASFFFVEPQPILVIPRVVGFSRTQLAIAAYLQPFHSQLCAISLQVLWKADQLSRALC